MHATISEATTLLECLAHRHDPRAAAALVQNETALSYEALLARVAALAGRLGDLGLARGDRVLLLFPNSIDHVVAVLAVMARGGVAVPLDPETGAARLAHVIEETDPRLCLIPEGMEGPAALSSAAYSLDALLAEGRALSQSRGVLETPAPRDEIAVIRYSSGSTGVPKGVPLSHGQILWTAATLARVYGLDERHKDYVIAPLSHSDGWQRTAMTLLAGGTAVLAEGPPSVPAILEDAGTHGITGFYLPPPLVRMLLKSPADRVRPALAACRTIETGSAPLSGAEIAALLALLPNARVFVHYGLTECSRALILDARAHPDKLETVGRPAPEVELRLSADDGAPAGAGQAGQILLRGPQQATSYWQRPGLTAARFPDGWLATGDYGMLDAEGFLTFLGRRDDLITSSGHHFFPAEVEAELGPFEDIAHYVIAGVPDPRGLVEEVPWAFVVPAAPETWSPQGFLSQARKRLPRYMVPRLVVAVPELPLTASGKPDRRRTVALYGAQEGRPT